MERGPLDPPAIIHYPAYDGDRVSYAVDMVLEDESVIALLDARNERPYVETYDLMRIAHDRTGWPAYVLGVGNDSVPALMADEERARSGPSLADVVEQVIGEWNNVRRVREQERNGFSDS